MPPPQKKNRSNRSWIHQHLNDPFVKKSQKDGYRARAAYKLQEIDEQVKLIKPGQVVIDLGAAPGSWSQYVARKLKGSGGAVYAIDIAPITPIDGVTFIPGSFDDQAVLATLQQGLHGRAVDVVLSDMAPNLSGIRVADTARVEYLVELAFDFALCHLKPGGSLLVKCFHGGSFADIVVRFKRCFTTVKIFKPEASRAASAENFVLGRGLKPGAGAEVQSL